MEIGSNVDSYIFWQGSRVHLNHWMNSNRYRFLQRYPAPSGHPNNSRKRWPLPKSEVKIQSIQQLDRFPHLVLHVSFVIVQKYNITEKGSARSTCCIISAFWLKVAYTCFIPDEKHYIFKRGADFESVHSAREVFIKPCWTTCKCELSFLSLEHSRQSLKHIFLQVVALKEKHMGFLFYCLCPVAKEIFNLCDTAVRGRWGTVVSTRGGWPWIPYF